MEQNNMVMNHQQQNMVHFNPQQQVQTNVAINVQDPVSTEIAFQALSNANQVAQHAQSQLLQAQHTVHQIEQQAQMQILRRDTMPNRSLRRRNNM